MIRKSVVAATALALSVLAFTPIQSAFADGDDCISFDVAESGLERIAPGLSYIDLNQNFVDAFGNLTAVKMRLERPFRLTSVTIAAKRRSPFVFAVEQDAAGCVRGIGLLRRAWFRRIMLGLERRSR